MIHVAHWVFRPNRRKKTKGIQGKAAAVSAGSGAVFCGALLGATSVFFIPEVNAEGATRDMGRAHADLSNAIQRCVDVAGRNGDAVGDVFFDIKTGEVRYRCQSDPPGQTYNVADAPKKSLAATASQVVPPASVPAVTPGPKAAKGAAAPAVPPPQKGVEAAVDRGAGRIVWVDKTIAFTPLTPEDCLHADGDDLHLPACKEAVRLGLIPKPKALDPIKTES